MRLQSIIEKICTINESLPSNVQIRVVDGLTLTFTNDSVIFKREASSTPFFPFVGVVPECDRKEYFSLAKETLSSIDFYQPLQKLLSDSKVRTAFVKLQREGSRLLKLPPKKKSKFEEMPLDKLLSDSQVISYLMMQRHPHSNIAKNSNLLDYFKVRTEKARPSELAPIRQELLRYLHDMP